MQIATLAATSLVTFDTLDVVLVVAARPVSGATLLP